MTVLAAKDIEWYSQESELEMKASTIEVDIFNSTVQKSIPRDWTSTAFAAYRTQLPVISLSNKRDFDSSNQYIDGWLSLIREGLYSIPSVEDIFVSIEGSDVDVWVVIPERDLAILHQIVEMEWELIKPFVSGENPAFLIDFHVVYRCGRNVEDLAPTRAIRLPRQVQ